jgi:trehalose 6-phosphate synthase/phosphatase
VERLLIVSNRLPVRIINADDGSLTVAPSMGGIATALKGPQQRLGGLWLGWPGDTIAEDHRPLVTDKLREIQAVPIFLDADEIRSFYAGFSNSMLWPLFHSAIDNLPLDASDDYDVYCKVNRKYAMAAAELVEQNGIVWIHDYQLCLVPGMLRALRPDLRIGFFLHIPFPAPDVFRVLPWRREILLGMAKSDLVGFHTPLYRDHFIAACQQLVDGRRSGDSVVIDGHVAHVGVFPMSIDFAQIDEAARKPSVDERVAELKRQAHGKKIIVGVDRLDYTKGLPRRMLAVDTLLRRWPQLQDDIHVIQVTAPSREEVDAYADFKRRVHEVAGRINAELGTTTDVPIHLLHRAIVGDELLALYRAA